jgi:hypothetical protein
VEGFIRPEWFCFDDAYRLGRRGRDGVVRARQCLGHCLAGDAVLHHGLLLLDVLVIAARAGRAAWVCAQVSAAWAQESIAQPVALVTSVEAMFRNVSAVLKVALTSGFL